MDFDIRFYQESFITWREHLPQSSKTLAPSTRDLMKAMQVLSISGNQHQNVKPVNHQQKCLINGICGIFDMKSDHTFTLHVYN